MQASDAAAPRERPAAARRVFRLDLLRSAAGGLIEPAWQTFALVVAIRHFESGPGAKALIAAAFMTGMVAVPVTQHYYSRLGLPAARIVAVNYVLSAGFLTAAALADALWGFILFGFLSAALQAQQLPLMLNVFAAAYPEARRGRRVSVGLSAGLSLALPFALLGGGLLDRAMALYPVLYLLAAAGAAVAALAAWRMPSPPLEKPKTANPLANLSLAWTDRVFGWMLVMWMIMGLGNLATLPLRVEYMGEPAYGINAANTQIALVVTIIPNLARIGAIVVWGQLFDRFNFFAIRAAVNACFIAAIALFFNARDLGVLYAAAVLYGIAMGGGNVNWSLWVTKFAPPGRESRYMSVHAFATGLRGAVAPFLGFSILAGADIQTAARVGMAMVAAATLMIWPISRLARRQKRARAEDVPAPVPRA